MLRTPRFHALALAGALLALSFSLPADTARAASTFLLQFGQHDSQEAAREQWENLQEDYPQLLGDLRFHLAEVDLPSGTKYRAQASALPSRSDAQELCTALTVDDVECLVVETSMYQPEPAQSEVAGEGDVAEVEMPAGDDAQIEEVMMDEDSAGVSLESVPELAEADEPESQTSSFRDSLFPWLRDDDEPEADEPIEPVAAEPASARIEPETASENMDREALASLSSQFDEIVSPEQAPTAEYEPEVESAAVVAARAPKNLAETNAVPAPQVPAEADDANAVDVEVAEAIRVPVSFGRAAPVPAKKPVGYGGFPSQASRQPTLWVQLAHFTDKDAAIAYWREVSYGNPELVRLLRVKVISPWKRNRYSAPKTSLRIGPFASRADVNNLCSLAAQRELRCTLVSEVGSTTAANSYAAPRTRTAPASRQNRIKAVGRGYGRPGTPPSGMYWVQLGAFGQVSAAQERWNELKSVHADLLEHMQPQVSYPVLSSSAQPVFHLRTGPFVNRVSASGLCNKLQARHLGCVVIQSR